MRAEELMIGDWVQIIEPCKYAGTIGTIKTLIDHKDDENAYFKVFLRNNPIHIGIEDICSDDICPIPLTTCILEMNGFAKHVCDFSIKDYSIKDFKLYGYLDNKGKVYYTITINNKEVRIDYVHELQHALRLCKINKKIEL